MLWRGFALWHEEIETHEEGQQKPGRTATAADRREFQNFAQEVNS